MKKIIAKKQVTSTFDSWWESDLSTIFADINSITIISAFVEHGGLYLIYTYEIEGEPITN
jgi:hypothetical protein